MLSARLLLTLPEFSGGARDHLMRALVKRQALESEPTVRRIFDMPDKGLRALASLALPKAAIADESGVPDAMDAEQRDAWLEHSEAAAAGQFHKNISSS